MEQAADHQRPAVGDDEQQQLERQRHRRRRQHVHAEREQQVRDHHVDDQERDEEQEADLKRAPQLGRHERGHDDAEVAVADVGALGGLAHLQRHGEERRAVARIGVLEDERAQRLLAAVGGRAEGRHRLGAGDVGAGGHPQRRLHRVVHPLAGGGHDGDRQDQRQARQHLRGRHRRRADRAAQDRQHHRDAHERRDHQQRERDQRQRRHRQDQHQRAGLEARGRGGVRVRGRRVRDSRERSPRERRPAARRRTRLISA